MKKEQYQEIVEYNILIPKGPQIFLNFKVNEKRHNIGQCYCI